MIITNINFFINCVKELKPTYQNANIKQQNQLLTFLKTWLWYNSSNKLFWTGQSSMAGLTQRVKEHQYSNLSSLKYMMNDEIGNEAFFELSNQEQFKKVFGFMQWNYTSSKENSSLRKHQNAESFYAPKINGDPAIAYKLAEIELTIEDQTADMLPKINSFFLNLQKDAIIFEIDLSNHRLNKFIQHLNEASVNLGIKLQILQLSNKGCIYSLIIDQGNLSNLHQLTINSLTKCFKNKSEIREFQNLYHYNISEQEIFNNINDRLNLIPSLLDFFDASFEIYNSDLNKQQFN